ncbi:DUF2188 domain-containing protein [Legionella lytica]|uniref:DUF2188 domain-containing protein n=1 Tax=Legionella lytica TaxID=96232 RepID=A0ABW8DB72_9GAMM
MRNEHHVLPHAAGGWNIKKAGKSRIIAHLDTKKEAVSKARALSIQEQSELIIHGKNGKIQTKDSHGHDPRTIKG